MFGTRQNKKRVSWRWAVLLVALVAGAMVFAACGESDPSPTATPEPPSVPATPVGDGDAMMDKDDDAMMDKDDDAMTDKDGDAMMDKDDDAMMDKDGDAMTDKDGDAMMDKDGDAMTDKDGDAMTDKDGDAMMDKDGDAMMDKDGDAMMSLSDIDETTTGAELIASLSEGEADCLRAAIGDASYEAMQDLTLSESAMGFDTFPLQCLEPDNAIDLSVAMVSLQAGGLSDDSQACIKDVFADLGVPSETMSETDSLRSFITMQLCLTDEEAQALDTSGGEDPLPLPSQLRCISEQTELENLFIIYQAFVNLESSTEPPTPSPEMTKAVAEIMAAQETCGIPTIIQGEGSAP